MSERWVMFVTLTTDKIEMIKRITEGGLPGSWLRSYDVDGFGGRGDVKLTRDQSKAKVFESFEAVMEEWKRQSTVLPLRPDGKPNRPLTAFTIQPRRLP